MSHRVFAITSVYENPELLPHFVDHYARLGVDRILIVLRTPRREESLCHAFVSANSCPTAVSWFPCNHFADADKAEVEERVLRENGVRPDDYVMHLDLDEFHEYPVPIISIVEVMSRKRNWALRGWLVDRIAEGGVLAPVRSTFDIGEQYPIGCDVTKNLLKACTQKIMLCQARVRLRDGINHDTCNAFYEKIPFGRIEDYVVHHFKWTDGVEARLRARLDGPSVGPEYRRECHRFLECIRTTGKLDLSAPGLMPRWLGALRYPM